MQKQETGFCVPGISWPLVLGKGEDLAGFPQSGVALRWGLLCPSHRQLLGCRHPKRDLPMSRGYFSGAFSCRGELSVGEEGQAAHSEKWTDSAGGVKESR